MPCLASPPPPCMDDAWQPCSMQTPLVPVFEAGPPPCLPLGTSRSQPEV